MKRNLCFRGPVAVLTALIASSVVAPIPPPMLKPSIPVATLSTPQMKLPSLPDGGKPHSRLKPASLAELAIVHTPKDMDHPWEAPANPASAYLQSITKEEPKKARVLPDAESLKKILSPDIKFESKADQRKYFADRVKEELDKILNYVEDIRRDSDLRITDERQNIGELISATDEIELVRGEIGRFGRDLLPDAMLEYKMLRNARQKDATPEDMRLEAATIEHAKREFEKLESRLSVYIEECASIKMLADNRRKVELRMMRSKDLRGGSIQEKQVLSDQFSTAQHTNKGTRIRIWPPQLSAKWNDYNTLDQRFRTVQKASIFRNRYWIGKKVDEKEQISRLRETKSSVGRLRDIAKNFASEVAASKDTALGQALGAFIQRTYNLENYVNQRIQKLLKARGGSSRQQEFHSASDYWATAADGHMAGVSAPQS